jgi:hypothetical protein
MTLLEHEAEPEAVSAFKTQVTDLATEQLVKLEAEQQRLATELASVVDQIKSVRAVLRATNYSNGSKPGPKPRGSQAGLKFNLSEERRTELMAWLKDNTDEITSTTVRAKFPNWSGSYCNMALKSLREEGLIRKSAQTGSLVIYRSMV